MFINNAILLSIFLTIGFGYKEYTDWKEGPLQNLLDKKKNKVSQLKKLKLELKKGEDFKRERNERYEELKEIAQRLLETSDKLPVAHPRIPEVLKALADISDEVSVDFLSIKPGKEKKLQFMTETPIEIKLEGTYVQIMSFLDSVSQLERIIIARDIALDSPITKGSTRQVKSDVTLVTYHLTEEVKTTDPSSLVLPAEKTEKKKKKKKKRSKRRRS